MIHLNFKQISGKDYTNFVQFKTIILFKGLVSTIIQINIYRKLSYPDLFQLLPYSSPFST